MQRCQIDYIICNIKKAEKTFFLELQQEFRNAISTETCNKKTYTFFNVKF